MNPLSWPEAVLIEVNAGCQNHCDGCGNPFAPQRGLVRQIPGRQWIEWLRSFATETAQIRISGGEPSLHPDFFSILNEAASYNAWVSVYTNGRWPDPPRFVTALRAVNQQAGLLVSLHGPNAEIHETFTRTPGSFQETLKNIRRATDAGIRVAISQVINRHNWDLLAPLAALAQTLGVEKVNLNRFIGPVGHPLEASSEQMAAVIAWVQTWRDPALKFGLGAGLPLCSTTDPGNFCPAGVTYMSIDPEGRAYPCAHAQTPVGSLFEKSLYEIWHSPMMQSWRSQGAIGCESCTLLPACSGGCPALREINHLKTDPLPVHPYHSRPEMPSQDLPLEIKPIAAFRIRRESFGFALIGSGRVVPVRESAYEILVACNGITTFAELAARFGSDGKGLLAHLWTMGLLRH
jgi:AdoMet-dependent heme synthase